LEQKAEVRRERTSDDIRVEPDDVIETLGTEDPRLKVIAEELANRVGRRIVELLYPKALTTAQISTALGESIQTVAYHVDRLVKAEVVKVAGYEKSQKGKAMRKYELRKPAILLVVQPANQDRKETLKSLKRIALRRFYERVLCSIAAFAISWVGSWLMIQLFVQGGIPYDIPLPPKRIPLPRMVPSVGIDPLELASLVIGIVVGLTIWYALSRRLVPLSKSHRE